MTDVVKVYVLGIEIKRSSEGSLLLSKIKFVQRLLRRLGTENCYGCKKSIEHGLKLSKKMVVVDCRIPYRDLIGCLMFLANATHPDVSYMVRLRQYILGIQSEYSNTRIKQDDADLKLKSQADWAGLVIR